MGKFVWLIIMFTEMMFAATAAQSGNIAKTILFCFSAYTCLKFMEGGFGNGE